ncbi:hypothetical protein F2P81_006215 [Scophthalmus maximus]|uniref:Uncharacterized protein n=1 Tax=Scophthalmus maximus TaxID=52904 RepID=A0A6A4T2L0_SCOMX|nr:hypothetical protein F2P81_006215 [Scophthalmus maximus]
MDADDWYKQGEKKSTWKPAKNLRKQVRQSRWTGNVEKAESSQALIKLCGKKIEINETEEVSEGRKVNKGYMNHSGIIPTSRTPLVLQQQLHQSLISGESSQFLAHVQDLSVPAVPKTRHPLEVSNPVTSPPLLLQHLHSVLPYVALTLSLKLSLWGFVIVFSFMHSVKPLQEFLRRHVCGSRFKLCRGEDCLQCQYSIAPADDLLMTNGWNEPEEPLMGNQSCVVKCKIDI